MVPVRPSWPRPRRDIGTSRSSSWKKGADVAFLDSRGHCAVALAQIRGHTELASLLALEQAQASPAGSGIRRLWQRGIPYTPISLVERVRANDIDAVTLFLDEGMDADAEGAEGMRALPAAAESGHVEMVSLLLRRGSALWKNAALVKAAAAGHLEVVTSLLLHGADPKFQYDAEVALVSTRDPAVAECLLGSGADVNALDGRRENALLAVLRECWHGHLGQELTTRLVRIYVTHGIDLRAYSDWSAPAGDIVGVARWCQLVRGFDDTWEVFELLRQATARSRPRAER